MRRDDNRVIRYFLLPLMCGLIAWAIGLASANLALDRGFGFQKKSSGPWSGWVRATAPTADPYTQAHFGRNGELPPPPLESLFFTAQADSVGAALSGACDYVITGQFPPARHWTLTVFDADGSLIVNPANRYSHSNATVVYATDGRVEVTLSALPQPGNWLPIATGKDHIFALALYDSPLATEAFLADAVLPDIRRIRCRS